MVVATPADAQVRPCSETSETSSNLPPAGSAPVYRCLELQFHPANDRVTEVPSMIDARTYVSVLKNLPSQRSQRQFPIYMPAGIQGDFWNLWRTGFLEDLWVEEIEEPYENGVVGKHVIFHMEERARVKVVDYVSADKDEKLQVDISKIESTLRDNEVEVRLDSFVDESTLRQVIGVIRTLYAEQGYNDAVVTPSRRELPGGPKLLHLTFSIASGPKVEIAEILFEGNETFDDATLRKQMKANKTKNRWIPFLSDTTFKEARFAEDQERVAEYYKNH